MVLNGAGSYTVIPCYTPLKSHKSQSKPPWIIALKSPWIGQEDAAKENHVQWLRQGLGPENLVLDQIFQGDFSMVISWNLMRLLFEPSTTLCVSRIVPVSEFWYSSWTLKPTKSLYSFRNGLVIWKYMFLKQFPRVVWSRIRIWIATWLYFLYRLKFDACRRTGDGVVICWVLMSHICLEAPKCDPIPSHTQMHWISWFSILHIICNMNLI